MPCIHRINSLKLSGVQVFNVFETFTFQQPMHHLYIIYTQGVDYVRAVLHPFGCKYSSITTFTLNPRYYFATMIQTERLMLFAFITKRFNGPTNSISNFDCWNFWVEVFPIFISIRFYETIARASPRVEHGQISKLNIKIF